MAFYPPPALSTAPDLLRHAHGHRGHSAAGRGDRVERNGEGVKVCEKCWLAYRYVGKHISMKENSTMTHEEFSRRGGKSRAKNNSKKVLSTIGRMGSSARWAGHIAKRPTVRVAEGEAKPA